MAWRSSGTTNDEMVDNLKRTFSLRLVEQNSDLIGYDDEWIAILWFSFRCFLPCMSWLGKTYCWSTTIFLHHHHHHCLFIGFKEQVRFGFHSKVNTDGGRSSDDDFRFWLSRGAYWLNFTFFHISMSTFFYNQTLTFFDNSLLFFQRFSSYLINRYWSWISFCGS